MPLSPASGRYANVGRNRSTVTHFELGYREVPSVTVTLIRATLEQAGGIELGENGSIFPRPKGRPR
jgi:hypothetical protein